MTHDLETLAGKGVATWEGDGAEGTVVDVSTPDDVLALMDMDLADVIILIHTAGASMLAPLFSDLIGIICTTGGLGAHVAILSREFGVPCVVSAELDAAAITGKRVRIDSSGEVFLLAS
jgi:phosphohistidine swiveling domain-containing protein